MPLYNDLKRSPFVEALTIIANNVSSVWLSLTFNAYVPLGCGLSSGYEALATRVFIERSQSTLLKRSRRVQQVTRSSIYRHILPTIMRVYPPQQRANRPPYPPPRSPNVPRPALTLNKLHCNQTVQSAAR